MKIASVVIDNTSKEVDRIFEYLVPEEYEKSILPGIKVIVPFGGGNKNIEGYIIEIKSNSDYDINKLKRIIDIADDEQWLNEEILDLVFYIREKYKCTLIEAIRCMVPSGTSLKENIYIKINKTVDINCSNVLSKLEGFDTGKFISLREINNCLGKPLNRAEVFKLKKNGFIDVKISMEQSVKIKTKEVYVAVNSSELSDFLSKNQPRYKKQSEVLNLILNCGENLSLSEICSKFGCSQSVVKALYEKGFLQKKNEELYRNPSDKEYYYSRVSLTDDQIDAVGKILRFYSSGSNKTLIHGVTGCGKTEIYLNIVENFIKNNFGAIVLVPEIALTPQTLERFKGRFGDVVAILHSKLSEGERFDEWRRIKSGKVKVVVGARSAVFAPVQNLKLIIIDEEHEYSYKSEISPKYHTRNIAEFRIDRNNGLLIMGSATPSIESYYKALNGEYNLIEIDKRVKNCTLPEVTVVNMKDELKNGNKSVFSSILLKKIDNTLLKNKQIILFLNRRGHSTFVSCRACGYVSKCSNCDVSLTYHAEDSKLVCHYCGFEYNLPKTCPTCGSKYIKYFGTGTERIEKEINKYFYKARTLRMDMDTTRKKGEHERIYNDFKAHRADILVGTQMISKGMDFKNVTLVGVIAADTTLNLPDFRAAERTFQLITQVAGRAGRGDEPGEVVVQTYTPEHYSIELAKEHNYKGFYEKEIKIREMLKYPPFSDILYVLFSSEDDHEISKYCSLIGEKIKCFEQDNIDILGPSPCHITRVKNKYRWHLILKGDVEKYYSILDNIIRKTLKDSKIMFSMDMNPYNMF
jgi:primosomal protein N' (replication factor Y)